MSSGSKSALPTLSFHENISKKPLKLLGSVVVNGKANQGFLIDLWNDFMEDMAFILETEEQATKRRRREAALTVFGRMSSQEQQGFRERGGVLPGEAEWLNPGSPEWHASFEHGSAGKKALE